MHLPTRLVNGRTSLTTFRWNWLKTGKSETRHRFASRPRKERIWRNNFALLKVREWTDNHRVSETGRLFSTNAWSSMKWYRRFYVTRSNCASRDMYKKREKSFPFAGYRRNRALSTLSILFRLTLSLRVWFIWTFTRSFSDSLKLRCPLKISRIFFVTFCAWILYFKYYFRISNVSSILTHTHTHTMQVTKPSLRKVHCKSDLSPIALTTRNLFTRNAMIFYLPLATKEGSI